MCRSETCAILKHVSDLHRANFIISRADDNMSFLTITFEVALLLLLKNKQTNKEMQPGRTFGLFSLIFMLQDHAFIMRLRYDEVCTVLIWNMFQKCIFFRMAHHANLKHVSGWHMFQNGMQHVRDLSLCGKGNTCFKTKLLDGLSYEKPGGTCVYNNSPPYVTSRWLPQDSPVELLW